MCGRYVFYDHQNPVIAQIVQEAKLKYEQVAFPLEEIFPSNQSIVLLAEEDKLTPMLMCWGYPKENSSQLIINARLETIRGNFFRDDYENRRCVVAASGFYEWDSKKKRHYIRSHDAQALYLAAIYRKINGEYHYCILTKEATESLKTVHSRMPVIMNEEQALHYCLFQQ